MRRSKWRYDAADGSAPLLVRDGIRFEARRSERTTCQPRFVIVDRIAGPVEMLSRTIVVGTDDPPPVVGAHGCRVGDRLRRGSAPTEVVHHANCSVLVAHPS
jgi:hypothetical protein